MFKYPNHHNVTWKMSTCSLASTYLIKTLQRAPHTNGTLGYEIATSLSVLGGRTGPRANARRTSATSTPAVSITEALTTDELLSILVANILLSGGIERRATMRGGWWWWWCR